MERSGSKHSQETRVEVRDARRGGWFWDFCDVFDREMPAHAKIVRLYLARCANDQQMAWPSQETIAEKCGLSRASVVRALKWLVDNGWVRRLSRAGGYNNLGTVYVLLNPPDVTSGGQLTHTESIQGESIHTESIPRESIPCESIQAESIHTDTPIGSVGHTEQYPRTISKERDKPIGACATSHFAQAHNEPGNQPGVPVGAMAGGARSPDPGLLGSSTEENEQEKKAARSSGETPDDRTLIAELTARLHQLPGVKPLRGHYSLIGRAYKEYGYQVVSEALEDMEFALIGRQAMGLPDISEKELAQMLFGKCRWNQKPVRRPGDRPAARTPGTDDIEAWCREHGYVRVPGTNRLVKASPPDGNGRGKCAGQG